jgi:hypothetical protein
MYDRTVWEGATICCTEIRVEGDLIYLIEEYLPTRPT